MQRYEEDLYRSKQRFRAGCSNRSDELMGNKYSYGIKRGRENGQCLSMFFNYPPEIRCLIYTMNPIENFIGNRKISKTRVHFQHMILCLKCSTISSWNLLKNGT